MYTITKALTSMLIYKIKEISSCNDLMAVYANSPTNMASAWNAHVLTIQGWHCLGKNIAPTLFTHGSYE